MNKVKVQALDIGEVSRISGVPPSTLRFYEEKGLIRSSGRHGLRRLFSYQVIEHLQFIALGQMAGFSLDDIAAMFGSDGKFKIDRKLLLIKASELDQDIRHLIAIRNGLQHAAECRAPTHLECPKFRRLLVVAGKKQVRSRTKPTEKQKRLK